MTEHADFEARTEKHYEIVRLIEAGDRRGEEMLCEMYSRGLTYMASRWTPEHGEDVAQQTLLITIKNIRAGEVKEPGALTLYIKNIARRLAYKSWGSSQRHQGSEETHARSFDLCRDPRPLPDEALDRKRELAIQAELLKKGFAELGEKEREILRRFYLLNQTKEQIQSEMGNLTDTQFRLAKSRAKGKLEVICGDLRKRLTDVPVRGAA